MAKKKNNKVSKKVEEGTKKKATKKVEEEVVETSEELDEIIEELEKDLVVQNSKVVEVKEDEEEDDEEDDDEDDDEDVVITKVKKKDKEETVKKEEVVKEFNMENEVRVQKLISIVACFIAVVSLILNFVIISKVDKLLPKEDKTTTSDEGEPVDYDVSMFKEINADEFIDMFDEKNGDDLYLVYTGRSDCGYCLKMLPNLQKSVEEYDYKLYYVDINKVDSEAAEKIMDMDETLASNFTATPMVFAVQDGKVKDVNAGYTEYDTYAKFLENFDIKKK